MNYEPMPIPSYTTPVGASDGCGTMVIDAGALARKIKTMEARIAELDAATRSASEWLERMRPSYFAEPDTTDREREKIDQMIEWLKALRKD